MISNYRVCTIKSPERRREERRTRREKALPLSAEFSIAAREETSKEEAVKRLWCRFKKQQTSACACESASSQYQLSRQGISITSHTVENC